MIQIAIYRFIYMNKALLFFILVFMTPLITTAQSAGASEPAALIGAAHAPELGRPRVGLVLSGGGARGLAHVGVLKALEEARIPIDLIVGTSMGAIVGGLYASGMSPAELENELLAVDWSGLFNGESPRDVRTQRQKEEDFAFSPVLQLGFRDGEFRLPTGAVSTRSLEALLRRYTLRTRRLASFDGLPTPFRAIATDLESGQAVVMDDGDLASALRASMSVPGVFSPLEINGRILGDGGLVNNLPIDVARRMGADVVIAVNIGTPLAGRETLGSVLGISAQMINILTEQNVQRSLATLTPADVLLAPPLGGLDSSDFDKGLELITLGYGHTRAMGGALARLSIGETPFHSWQMARHGPRKTAPDDPGLLGPLAFVRITGVAPDRLPRLQRALGVQPQQPFSPSKIAADLQMLAATGDFARVDYRLEPAAGTAGEGLVYALNENSWGPNYLRVGLDLRTDFRGQGAFNLRMSHNRHWLTEYGTEWRNRIQLGEAMGIYTAIYQPLGNTRDLFATAWLDARLRKVDVYDPNGNASAVLRRADRYAGAELGWPLGVGGQLGEARVGLLAGQRSTTPELVSSSSSASGIASNSWSEHALRVTYAVDRLDHANFPQSGHNIHLEMDTGRRTTSSGTHGFNRLELRATLVGTWATDTVNSYIRFARVSQSSSAVEDYSLGGFQKLSGYRTGQVSGNLLALGRLVWYRRMPWDIPVARGVFVGASLEAGNAWANRSSITARDLRIGSSLFLGADTGVGPVYFSVVHAPRGYSGIYVFVGRP
jgi:NTE family protein